MDDISSNLGLSFFELYVIPFEHDMNEEKFQEYDPILRKIYFACAIDMDYLIEELSS